MKLDTKSVRCFVGGYIETHWSFTEDGKRSYTRWNAKITSFHETLGTLFFGLEKLELYRGGQWIKLKDTIYLIKRSNFNWEFRNFNGSHVVVSRDGEVSIVLRLAPK